MYYKKIAYKNQEGSEKIRSPLANSAFVSPRNLLLRMRCLDLMTMPWRKVVKRHPLGKLK
ncbi:hypothetical protein ACTXT7_016049 [Hymenolepis weldensis]